MTNVDDWIVGLRGPAVRNTLHYLVAHADDEWTLELTMAMLAADLRVSRSAAKSRLDTLARRQLVHAMPRPRAWWTVRVRYPWSDIELTHQAEDIVAREWMRVEAPRRLAEIARRGREREDLIRRGELRIEDVWAR